MQNPIPTEPKKSNTGMMIGVGVIVVFVLMCCCAVVVIGALTLLGPSVGKTFSSINQDMMLTAIPGGMPTISPDMTMPSMPTISPDMTMPSISDVVPSGGKGDEIQRAQAWSYVVVAAALDGCTLGGTSAVSSTKITVKQEADSDGVWVEEWAVKCDGGSNKTYTVTFTPQASGSTDIKVK